MKVSILRSAAVIPPIRDSGLQEKALQSGALEDASDDRDQATTDQKGDGQKAQQKTAPSLGWV